MSGLLRRIKRSRPADAGEPLPEGQAAAPEGAAPATEPATAATEPVSAETPAAVAAQPATETPAPAAAEPATEKPVLLADPGTPAGVDPGTAALRPPAGRRGRLRRRLRYLRRARELMLRDLGGLLYEIHRTGGGNVEAHGNIVGAKVHRIAGLDAEAHALETALAAPRPDAVVFQPGIGGTCPACGELYGSAARFCSNCGTPLGAAALPAPAPAPATPAPATRESVFGRPAPPAEALSSGDPLRSPAQPTPDRAAAERPGAATIAGDDATQAATPVGEESVAAAAAPTDAETAVIDAPAEAARDTGTTTPGEDASEAVADEPTGTGDAPAAADEPSSDDPQAAADEPTSGDDPQATADEPSGDDPQAAADEPSGDDQQATADDPPATDADEPATGEPGKTGGGDAEKNPFSGLSNGRAEDHTPPELSSGDPLAARERRS